MPQRTSLADADCAIAQALDVVGDWWTLLIVRDTARGVHRFDALQQELGVSRKVLTERLRLLVDAGVLSREPYQDRPPRYEYRLTPRGRALLPVLIALQDWGDTWVLGEGETMATTAEASKEAARVHALVGTRLPELRLLDHDGAPRDPVSRHPVHRPVLLPRRLRPPGRLPAGLGRDPGRERLHARILHLPGPVGRVRRGGRDRARGLHPAPGRAAGLRGRGAAALPAAVRRGAGADGGAAPAHLPRGRHQPH